nr:MAG TPA: hypothetical protein [Caudoviricetes sp.]
MAIPRKLRGYLGNARQIQRWDVAASTAVIQRAG